MALRYGDGSVSFQVVQVWIRHSGENRSPSQRVDSSFRQNDGKAGMTVNMTARPRPCGHIAIYHSPAYVFIIAMPLQPSFRRKPESMLAGSITVAGDYDAGFRRKPE